MADNKYRPSFIFSLFTSGLLCLLLLVLIYGLTHTSSEPTILGRYSLGYFALLLGLAVGTGALAWLLFFPRPAFVRWAGNLYLLLASTVVAVVGAEIGLRLVNPWGIELFSLLPYHMQGMVDHPQLGYVHPGSITYHLGDNRVSLNAHGHRDDEMPVEKPAGERRILVLGDSVTFGWGVDQGQDFPARLETLLRQRTGTAWQVINAGVNGYNSEQEATYFATEGIRFQPDIVLLVYVGNDVEPVFDPNVVTWRRYPTWPSSLPEFLERTRSLSYLYQTTKLFQRMAELRPPDAGAPGRSLTDHPGWPASLKALKSISELCERRKIPFLVALESGSAEKIPVQLRQADIDAITLGPAWSRVAPDKHRVSRVDPHPSAAVHAEFAALLLEELRARGWLEESPGG
jgi:lysophospholipase L1-like esterase